MQDKEFDNLFNDKDAKWMDFKQPSVFNDPLYLTNTPKDEIRNIIAEKEKPIPSDTREAINKFIKDKRIKKWSERSIRRAVKRKWNIYVA